MALTGPKREPSRSANRRRFQRSFVRHVHSILARGYSRLDARAFVQREEEDITGEITRSMQAVVQDQGAPGWAKYYWPAEETRVHEHGRLGKRRLRIDIEIMRHGIETRPRFRFEAKRLHDAASRREYLGNEGLGRFLDGRYAVDDEVAGMLGYVQDGSVDMQGQGLAALIKSRPKEYAVRKGWGWAKFTIVPGLSTFRSGHQRANLPPITLFHTMLLFCGPRVAD